MHIMLAIALTQLSHAEPPEASTEKAVPAPATPRTTPKVLDQREPLMRMQLDPGFVRWVTRRELPNEIYTSRGPMTVDLYEDWVFIRTKEGEAHIIPREFVVYVGSIDLDEL